MTNGYLNVCKECIKKYERNKRKSDPEKYKKANRERYLIIRHGGKYQESIRRSRIKHPEIMRKAQHKWKRKNKHKVLANKAVKRAILGGFLKRQPCEVCHTTENVHAHHEDYSKPLEVKWLCKDHHAERHRELREIARAL